MTTSFLLPWLTHPLSLQLGRALLHFVWQGAVAWIVAGLVIYGLRNSTAARRYGVLLGLFTVTAAAPVFTLMLLRQSAAQPFIAAEPAVANLDAAASLRETSDHRVDAPQNSLPTPLAPGDLQEIASVPILETRAPQSSEPRTTRVEQFLPWLVAAWALGVVGCSLRLLIGFIGVLRVRWCGRSPAPDIAGKICRELQQRLGLSQAIPVCESLLIQVPIVVGWLKPLILFPVGMITGLDEAQLRALLAHELAHLRRHDYIVNIVQTVVETLLFYHPAVWWLSRRLRRERELCCDDIVVELTGNRLVYARTLSELADRAMSPKLATAANGGPLLARIRHILSIPEPKPASRPASWAGVVLLLILVGGGLVLRANLQADQGGIATTRSSSADAEFLADQFNLAIRRQRIPYLDETKVQALRQSLHDGIAEHLDQPLSAQRRQQFAAAIEANVKREFDPAEKDTLYLEFQNRFQTLIWELRLALELPELTPEQLARLNAQRDWMRAEIRKLPESAKFRLTHKDELAKLESLFDDALNPFFNAPMSEKEFALFQAAYQQKMEGNRSETRLVFAASWLFQAAWTVQRDVLLQKYPVENIGSGVHNLRWSLTVTRHVGNVSLDVGDLQKQNRDIYVDVMKMIFVPGDASAEPDDRAAWLHEKGQGDLAFDGKQDALIGVRGAKLAVANATDWQSADLIPLADLETLLETSGHEFLSLSTFVEADGDPANGIRRPRAAAPSIVMRTNEGNIAVIRILSISGSTPIIRSRPRPLPPNPPLHPGDILGAKPKDIEEDLPSEERRGSFLSEMISRVAIESRGSQSPIRIGITKAEWGPWQKVDTAGNLVDEVEVPEDYQEVYRTVRPKHVHNFKGSSGVAWSNVWAEHSAILDVVAIDQQGKKHNPIGTLVWDEKKRKVTILSWPWGDQNSLLMDLFELPIEETQRFEYRLRPFHQSATLEGLLQQAGEKTKPALEDESPVEKAEDLRSQERRGRETRAEQQEARAEPQAEKEPAAPAKARQPWQAYGRVTDANGQPLAGVEVAAHCGLGTLKKTGTATTDENGKYQLNFSPGILFHNDSGPMIQAATIHAHKAGYFEINLNQQGGRVATNGPISEDILKEWKKRQEDVFQPNQPQEINFVMQPAGRVSGKLVDEQGKPLAGYSVSLAGPDLPPSSSVLAQTKADEQGRFALEDIPTTFRFQFVVRKSNPKPPWGDSWASAALRFERPVSGDLRAWFGEREIQLDEFTLRVVGPGMHDKTAMPLAGNAGLLNLIAADPAQVLEQTDMHLVAKSAVLTLSNQPRANTPPSLVTESVPSSPAHKSKTNLARTRPNDHGEFQITFENPSGFDLVKGRHQVIFQVFVGVSQTPIREKIFRQLGISPDGKYTVPVKIAPAWIDDSRVSLTFVTIQPDHDAWVKAFFHQGKGTSYSGIWTSDGGLLPTIPWNVVDRP